MSDFLFAPLETLTFSPFIVQWPFPTASETEPSHWNSSATPEGHWSFCRPLGGACYFSVTGLVTKARGSSFQGCLILNPRWFLKLKHLPLSDGKKVGCPDTLTADCFIWITDSERRPGLQGPTISLTISQQEVLVGVFKQNILFYHQCQYWINDHGWKWYRIMPKRTRQARYMSISGLFKNTGEIRGFQSLPKMAKVSILV